VTKKPKVTYIRVQIEVTPERSERLGQLAVMCGLRTKKRLIEEALNHFENDIRRRRMGRSIGSASPDGNFIAIENFALETAASAHDPQEGL